MLRPIRTHQSSIYSILGNRNVDVTSYMDPKYRWIQIVHLHLYCSAILMSGKFRTIPTSNFCDSDELSKQLNHTLPTTAPHSISFIPSITRTREWTIRIGTRSTTVGSVTVMCTGWTFIFIYAQSLERRWNHEEKNAKNRSPSPIILASSVKHLLNLSFRVFWNCTFKQS